MSFPTISQANHASVESVQNRPLVLNEGQLFHGRIHRLLPGQMAEVQIGDQKLFAKLEVPLRAGDAYYFQVNAVQPELQLKIISGPLNADGKSLPLTGLLDALQLSKSTEMQTLLSFIIKNKVPLTRNEMLAAEQFLKSIPASSHQEALSSIQKMAENKLPFTENAFRAVFGVESKLGLHETLNTLRQVLQTDTTLPPQTKSDLLASLDHVAKPFGQVVGSQVLAQAVLSLLDNEATPEVRFQVLQLLKDAGIMPRTASLANLNQVLSSLQNTQTATSNSTTVNQQQPANNPITPPEQIPTVLRTLAESVISNPFRVDASGVGPKEQLLQFFGQSLQSNQSEPLTQLIRLTETNNNEIIRSMIQTAETNAQTAVDGRVIHEALKSIVQSLGVQYEASLNTRDTNFNQLLHQLKPQLMALLQDPTTAAAIRESAEILVTRMNGPLFVSGENGIQHQLIMQIPFELFGKSIDATLQWNGRMQEDGKIDADFARILFYLDLHSLKETIVDMQVQNRVVSLNIYNEDPTIKTIGTLFQQNLKDGLENIGYRLSGIFFKTFEEKEKVQKPNQQQVRMTDGQGVDFRI